MTSIRALAIVALLTIVPTDLFSQPNQSRTRAVTFPQHSKASSPDHRYSIVEIEGETPPYHTVYLDDRRLKTHRKLLDYERGIEVLWNPDSRSFALTNYGGSDYTECKIVFVDFHAGEINVSDELVKRSTSEDRPHLTGNHHVYMVGTNWLHSKTLKVKVWGYGDVDPSGFTRFYTYVVGRGPRPLR